MHDIDPTKYTAHTHPGKFEAQSPATEYFYEQMCNGDGETIYAITEHGDHDEEDYSWESPEATIFHINAEEAEAFSLPIGHTFMICEDSQGFVIGSVHSTRAEAEAAFRAWLGL